MIKGKKDHWWKKGQIWQIDMGMKSLIQGKYPVLHCWKACKPGQSVTYQDKTTLCTFIRAIFYYRGSQVLPYLPSVEPQ